MDWSAYDAPPKGGGHIITLGTAHLSPYDLVGSHGLRNPSLAMRLMGDSIEIEASVHARLTEDAQTELCRDGSYSFLLWIDRELHADFRDSQCNADDHVYHVRFATTELSCTVTEYSISSTGGDFTLTAIGNPREASYSPPRSSAGFWPHIFRWKLSQSECGIDKPRNGIHACGFAAEMVCSSGFDPLTFDYKSGGLSFPVGFNRTDPRTWGTLMIAIRGDSSYVE
jgi:hypothetical protein